MSFLNILVYIVLPVITVAYFYVKKKWSYFEDEGIPYIKASGIMGSMSEVGSTLHFTEFLRKVYNNGRGKDVIAGYYTMLSPTIMVTDVELLKRILIKDFNVFSDRGFFVNEKKDILTGSLVSQDGDKWRFLRQKLTPAFTSGKIKMMFSAIKEQGDILLESIDKASKSGSVDMKDIANRYNIDITSSCAFGMESKTMKNEHPEFVSVFRRVFGEEGVGLAYFFFLMQFKKLALFLNLRQFDKDVIAFFSDIVSGAIKYREDNNVARSDYLNMLIQLKNTGSIDGEKLSESRKLTMDQCVSQAFVFFLGGVDTSSTTLSFVILQLSHRPEVQEKLREEVLAKIKDSNDEITYENLQEMTYLQQVLNGKFELSLKIRSSFVIKFVSFCRNHAASSSSLRILPSSHARLSNSRLKARNQERNSNSYPKHLLALRRSLLG